jgi:hypothetical protein
MMIPPEEEVIVSVRPGSIPDVAIRMGATYFIDMPCWGSVLECEGAQDGPGDWHYSQVGWLVELKMRRRRAWWKSQRSGGMVSTDGEDDDT